MYIYIRMASRTLCGLGTGRRSERKSAASSGKTEDGTALARVSVSA